VTIKVMGPARAHSTRLPGRVARRYPSDLTDAQWQVIAAHLPRYVPGGRGRPRVWPARRIVEAILYLDRTGCAWRYLPTDFPPWQTVYGYFAAWRDDGTLARLHGELRAQVRAAAGRDAQPTAAVIDSQSVRAADTVPTATRGWDAAKKVNGRKRHIAVDTTGLLLDVVITAASVQDRDAARPLLWNLHRACPRVRLAWADSGYQAHRLTTWATALRITLQIVRRPDGLHTFTVLPRRWVVERTLCAARRSVVFPVQPGGIRREVPGSNGLPGSERLRGQQHARKPGGRVQWSGTARRGDPRDMAKAGLPEA
jgi:transposase